MLTCTEVLTLQSTFAKYNTLSTNNLLVLHDREALLTQTRAMDIVTYSNHTNLSNFYPNQITLKVEIVTQKRLFLKMRNCYPGKTSV